MPRALWKGAITFGLVHIPVALYPASHDDAIDFDWLDRRSMDPVGYKRVNKKTGKEIAKEDIVRGVRQEDGQYIVLSDDEIRAAYPKTTQTIEIEAFVPANEIPFVYLDRPYFLEPVGKAEKVYALLRETLGSTGKIGIARVVIQTKQHLGALIPAGPALMLNTLRWASEVRSWDELNLPGEGKQTPKLSSGEMKMAAQLVEDMSSSWKPEAYPNTFNESVMALVRKKAAAGEAQAVEPVEKLETGTAGSNVVDLSDLLRRSLKGRAAAPAKKAARTTPKRPAAKRHAA